MQATDFSALNSFFDHIYVITLHRAVERQERISKDLQGLAFSFFYGADKNDFSIPELVQSGVYDPKKARSIHRYEKEMSGGQIGCSWSHKQVYEDVLSKGYQRVLILEDDVEATADICHFNEVVASLPSDWELLYLDYHKNDTATLTGKIKQQLYHVQHRLGGLKWNHRMIRNLYAKPLSAMLKKAGYHMFTSAYAITSAAAGKLLSMQTPIAYIADDLLAHAVTNEIVNGFVSVPKMFAQESQTDKSSISYVED